MHNKPVVYWSRYEMELFDGKFTSQVFPWHFHEEYTVIAVADGTVSYNFQNEVIHVGKKQVFIINPYEAHYNKALDSSGWTYKVFFLPRSLFEIDGGQRFQTFKREVINNKNLYKQLINCHFQLESPVSLSEYATITASIKALLLPYISSQVKSKRSYRQVSPAIDHIQANLSHKVSNEELASLCGISKFYFQKLFKISTGLTVREYINQQRMEACRLLLLEEEKAGNVAYATGYFDQSHFNHQFKRMYGLTPKKFLNNAS